MTDNDKRLYRLLSANHLGCRLYEEDGRVYFQWLRPHQNECADALDLEGRFRKVSGGDLPTGVVGGLDVALDAIDKVLATCFPNGELTLTTIFFSSPGGPGRWGLGEDFPTDPKAGN